MMHVNWGMAIPIIISAILSAMLGAALGYLMTPRRNVDRTGPEQVEFMRNLLAFLLVAAFISVLPVLTYKSIPGGNKEILTYMLGQLSGMATMALGFYFTNKAGQDAVDAKRADNTAKMAEAITETAKTARVAAGDGENAQAPRAPVTVDADALPWDQRIHAADKSLDADGRWIKLPDLDPAFVKSVEDELRAALKGD